MTTNKKKGKVYLVGAGPGRDDLITVRGADILKTADCVIYDKLANPALLKYSSANAEIIHVPKRVGDGSFTQQQINKLLVDKASEGKTVVSGRPAVTYYFQSARMDIDSGMTVAPGTSDAAAVHIGSPDPHDLLGFAPGNRATGVVVRRRKLAHDLHPEADDEWIIQSTSGLNWFWSPWILIVPGSLP